MKKTIIFILSICISVNLYSQTNSKLKTGSTRHIDSGELLYKRFIGEKIPFSNITTIDSEKINFNALDGKIVFIDFWFKSCPACMAEMKGLEKLYEKYHSKNIIFLMITFENKSTIESVIDKYGLKYKIASVKRNIIDSWGIPRGYPSNIILDKNAKIIYAKGGANGNEEIATKEVMKDFGSVIESQIAH